MKILYVQQTVNCEPINSLLQKLDQQTYWCWYFAWHKMIPRFIIAQRLRHLYQSVFNLKIRLQCYIRLPYGIFRHLNLFPNKLASLTSDYQPQQIFVRITISYYQRTVSGQSLHQKHSELLTIINKKKINCK